nr:ribonuclease H-like domain-containing protein [Tanacetum cinerariifolium]
MARDDTIITNTTPTSTNKSFHSIYLSEWDKQDDLVKVWILGTLEESLQDQVVTTPRNAKALWDHIKDLFHDNKDARAITFDGELQSIKLASLTINAYCTKIKVMADGLANLGENVSDKNLVMYALNGLDTRYKGIARLIRHSQPLPKFETARNMLLLEESNLQEATDHANTYDSSSSSPTLLMATKTDTKSTHTKTQPLPQICNHFNKGSCKFEDRFKNGTWILVPRPVGINLVRSMWLFKHKFHADGTLSRYKARLVANGSSQQLGIDCDETFSPVVKPATIRTVLSLAVSRKHLVLGFSDLQVMPLVLDFTTAVQVITSLHNEFDMTNLGALNYFLGISATRHSTRLFLSQKQYAIKLLARAHMTNCNPSRTPVDTDSKLGPEGVPIQDPTLYRSLASGLQYLTFTRPDISYAVQQICLYMHDPREPYLAALKRILRYIRGTLDFGFHLYSSTIISLIGYTDADWAGCPSTRRSTSGYCVFLGDNLLSWSSKRQQTISRSSAEAEYRGVANVVAETAWLRTFFESYTLHCPLQLLSTVTLTNRSNHKDVTGFDDSDYAKDLDKGRGGVYGPYGGYEGSYLAKGTLGRVREVLKAKTVEVLKVGTEHNVADVLMKKEQKGFSVWASKFDDNKKRVKMRALLIQHGCKAALEVLPVDMEAQTKAELNKKAQSAVILCLGNKVLREVTGETTAAGVWSKLETLYMTNIIRTLCGYLTLWMRSFDFGGRDGHTKFKENQRKLRGKSRSKSRGGRLKCYICQSEDHLKRNCPKNNRKKSSGYVNKDDQPSFSGSIYDGSEVMMVMSAEALLDWIMDSGGSYHMTPRLDLFFDFLDCDGGRVLLGDNRECKIRGIGKSGKIKVINRSRIVLSGTQRDNCVYSLDGHAVAGELNASV